ncbi:siderophore-interacting protein [Aeromonas cavernicola]|uniref:Siderophore-interacting protein n=1 Tax=Aeromonas cavernicola TaxID=1006623 RepID=A0A2H9U1G7_9GAMM|nr:siderophore-interacting protein [Aeromonas cavernicola]PJG57853.1 siderophore-interacting protein [Aeromonas cavernicola]
MSPILPAKRPRLVTVKTAVQLSPHLRRLCFSGSELADYPVTCGGAHIKVMLAQPYQSEPVLPVMTASGPRWANPEDKPIIRTYSIRAVRPETQELEIDFVIHGDSGPASAFAVHAKPGDKVILSGPGGPHPMLPLADHYLLVGDLTALPAITAMCEVMPTNARGEIAIVVPDKADAQPISLPIGVRCQWFVGEPAASGLLDHVLSLPLSRDGGFFWLGGEEALVLPLRRYLRSTLEVDRQSLYAVPYWRRGKSEEAYHQTRHEVMDNESDR